MAQVHPVQQYRALHKLTLEDMGKLVGVSAVTVHRWETRQRTPRGQDLEKICSVTGASVADVLGVSESAA